MGDYFQKIVVPDVSEDEAPRLAERLRDWLVAREIIEPTPSLELDDEPLYRPGPAYRTTLAQHGLDEEEMDEDLDVDIGLHIAVGRTVFWSTDTELTCRACGERFSPGEDWSDAADAWYEGDDSVSYACPKCGRPERLTEWRGEWPWGFGNLGLEFWNWTALSEQFEREVAEQLGHRTVIVRGKL
ncbi:hypothetical protein [Vitiosangium sp. GDMCC 1.1324]|uniref:hypothetical protein n=1 Tax=Vitiosangium sp. (strain GDMCC 1.1324) TaxID=2138576 RepID=UPI000D37CDEA|nr:hypothetical protein [Vitiosangium sp. GDMCC 1.1324]PTL81961.1 hypothetical protein DAT35_19285 [Vitiosangium sp. GDMCC 1.1324]